MIRSSYVADSAGWIFLTAGGLIIGVAAPDDSPLLPELWHLIEGKADPSAVLDVLTRGGISSAPDFVIAALGKAGKVLVRGGARVTVEGSESATLAGAGFSSWAERSFDRVDAVSCEVVASGAVRLPFLSGAVRAGWFGAAVAGVAVFDTATPTVELIETTPAPPVEPEPPVELVESNPTPPVELVETPAPIEVVSTSSTAETPVSETTVVASTDEEEDDEVAADPAKPTAYDFLFGETAYRTVEEAAVRPSADDDEAKAGLEDRTVVASDLAKLRAQRRAGRGRAVESAAPAATFYLELSTGGREQLDQPLVIGRAPSATALAGGKIPRLVTMTTPNQDISRTHAQISVEGGTVVVTDLHSSNGTIVTLPGRAAQKLREGETTPVIPGTIIDLGDGATLTVREA
jgi:hypothetical protein